MATATYLQKPDTHLTEEGIALYVDALKLGRIPELPDWITKHVSECVECKQNITGLFALLYDEDYKDVRFHPFFDRQRRRAGRLWYRIAALLLLALGIGVITYIASRAPGEGDRSTTTASGRQPGPPVADTNAGSPGTTHEARKGAELSEAFAENAELENMVGAHTRSLSVNVTSPQAGAHVNGIVVFDWTGGPPGRALVEVYNNRKELQRSLEAGTPPLKLREPLPPGLYYWKLLGEDELHYMGKFLVKEAAGGLTRPEGQNRPSGMEMR